MSYMVLRGCAVSAQGVYNRLAWTHMIVRTTHSSASQASPDEVKAARVWITRLRPDSIVSPKACEVSFSRSSGPGGQNVNKVSSKATLRVPLDELLPRVPALLHSSIRSSRYYAAKSDSLLIQADDSRKQSSNEANCFQKLYDDIVQCAARVLPGETSEAQKIKVKDLQKAENERRLKTKKTLSSKKTARRSRGDD